MNSNELCWNMLKCVERMASHRPLTIAAASQVWGRLEQKHRHTESSLEQISPATQTTQITPLQQLDKQLQLRPRSDLTSHKTRRRSLKERILKLGLCPMSSKCQNLKLHRSNLSICSSYLPWKVQLNRTCVWTNSTIQRHPIQEKKRHGLTITV